MKPKDAEHDFLMLMKKGEEFEFKDDLADEDHYYICQFKGFVE